MPFDDHLDRLLKRYPDLAVCAGSIRAAYDALEGCYTAGGKLLLCGNGGSAADCDHIVGELVKAFRLKRPLSEPVRAALAGGEYGAALADKLQGALPAINLTAHSALIAAISNDIGAEMVYAQQTLAYGQRGDALIAITTSGNSANVLHAVAAARALGLTTVGFTGRSGGRLRDLCDVTICVPADDTGDIQERHLPIYHALCAALESHFFAE